MEFVPDQRMEHDHQSKTTEALCSRKEAPLISLIREDRSLLFARRNSLTAVYHNDNGIDRLSQGPVKRVEGACGGLFRPLM